MLRVSPNPDLLLVLLGHLLLGLPLPATLLLALRDLPLVLRHLVGVPLGAAPPVRLARVVVLGGVLQRLLRGAVDGPLDLILGVLDGLLGVLARLVKVGWGLGLGLGLRLGLELGFGLRLGLGLGLGSLRALRVASSAFYFLTPTLTLTLTLTLALTLTLGLRRLARRLLGLLPQP